MNYSKCDIFYACFALIGTLAGFSGFVVFLFVFGNFQAALWAFFAGVYASAVLFLYYLKMREILDQWYGSSQLFRISLFGGVGAIASSIAILCYFIAVISLHEGLPTQSTMGKSHFVMGVWSCMALKWSVTTTVVARNHSRRLRSGYEEL